MKVREELDKELNRLLKDIMKKTDIPQDASVNEIFELAEKKNVFDPKTYIYTEDTDYIYELLNFSLGLCHIWANYKKDNPNAQLLDINKCILQYMKDMWGLERRLQ